MKKDIGIFDLLYVLAKRKSFVIIFTLVFAVGAIIYALVAQKYWISKAVLVPISETTGLSGLDSGLLGMLGSSLLGGVKGNPAVEFVSIMQSRTFREKVIEEFDLINYFKLADRPRDEAMELARMKLANSVSSISVDPESNLVTIKIETKDKLFSRDIAQFYLDELQNYLHFNRGSKSKLQREFLENQVLGTRADIDSLAVALRDFQKRNRTIGLDEQTTALITLYGTSVSEFFKADLEYELARQQFGPDSPVLEDLGRRKSILQDKIKELESSDSKLVPAYLLQVDRIPDLALQYAQLRLNLEIKQKVFEYLYPQYEIARLDEAREMPSFDILDSPSLAGLRSKPKRAILVSVITFMAFLLACLLAVLKENLQVVYKDKVDRILGELKGSKKTRE